MVAPIQARQISIHALREERDEILCSRRTRLHRFQSTRSARSATKRTRLSSSTGWRFQSTRSARSATRCIRLPRFLSPISIHALREERDIADRPARLSGFRYFNPRAPRGARPALRFGPFKCFLFQSTRSARSATVVHDAVIKRLVRFQSTRSARSATHPPPDRRGHGRHFNPRAPRGARRILRSPAAGSGKFQSTRSARSATSSGW